MKKEKGSKSGRELGKSNTGECSNVLRYSSKFLLHDVGVPQCVEECRLTVIDVPHYSDDGRTLHQHCLVGRRRPDVKNTRTLTAVFK